MSRPWYAAATIAVVMSGSSAALADDDDGGEWFEPEAEAVEEPPEAPAPRARPAPRKEPAAVPAAPAAVTRPDESQRRSARPKSSRSLSLVLGKARFDAPELADALDRAGFDHDASELRFVGVQGTRVHRRLVLGLGGTYAWSERLDRPDGAGGRMTLMQLRGQLGWALVHSKKWLLYPAFELSASHLEIDLGAPGAESVDGALASPRTGTELTKRSLSAGGVVAVERRFALRKKSHRGHEPFFSIGLRAGIARDLISSPWRVDGDGDALGPEEHATTKYVGLTLGFGAARF